MYINDDIISRALNESINEWMMNETLGRSWNAAQQAFDDQRKAQAGAWWKKITPSWSFLKNSLYNWMDKRTNGQWNQKYGAYPDSKWMNYKALGGTGGQFFFMNVLEKWFSICRKNISQCIQNKMNPSNFGGQVYYDQEVQNMYNAYLEQHEKDNESGKNGAPTKPFNFSEWLNVQLNAKNITNEFLKEHEANSPEGYIKKHCDYESFMDFASKRLGNFDKDTNDEYTYALQEYLNQNVDSRNPEETLRAMNITDFSWFLAKSGSKFKGGKKEEPKQQQQQETPKEKETQGQGKEAPKEGGSTEPRGKDSATPNNPNEQNKYNYTNSAFKQTIGNDNWFG